MKKNLFTAAFIGAILVGFAAYKGWLNLGKPVTVKAHYVEMNCGDKSVDLRVTEVSDKAHASLVGKTISPEGFFLQKDFSDLIKEKVKGRGEQNTVKEFTLEGYLIEGEPKHCFGSLCFKVKRFKSEGDSVFIETK